LEKVLNAWKWNMLAEWIMRFLKKIDKQLCARITQLSNAVKAALNPELQREEEILNALVLGDERVSFKTLMETPFYNTLQILLMAKDKDQIETPPPWDEGIRQAIENYREVAFEL
jgi:hypothetical protein